MRCSRVVVAFLLVLSVFLFLRCDGAKTTPGLQGLADPSRDTRLGKAGTLSPTDFADLAELARPKRLDVVTDPAFQRWLPVGEAAPTLLAIHPEAHRALVTVGYLCVLYDLQSGQELKSWTEHFASACFSGDGRRLATLGVDSPGSPTVSTACRSVAVWDAGTGDEICRITPSGQVENRAPRDSITIVLNVEGTRLAISQFHDSFDPSHPAGVLLFDVESGKLLTAVSF